MGLRLGEGVDQRRPRQRAVGCLAATKGGPHSNGDGDLTHATGTERLAGGRVGGYEVLPAYQRANGMDAAAFLLQERAGDALAEVGQAVRPVRGFVVIRVTRGLDTCVGELSLGLGEPFSDDRGALRWERADDCGHMPGFGRGAAAPSDGSTPRSLSRKKSFYRH